MAQQLTRAEALAAATLTYCPADLASVPCPWGRADCLGVAETDGRLVACWRAVLGETTEREAMTVSDEAKCHEWDEGDGCWRFSHDCVAPLGDRFMGEGYCPTCGKRLDAGGTETAMVPAVTAEAVQKTAFFGTLSRAVAANEEVCFVRCEPYDQRIILAALQQSTGLAAAEWLVSQHMLRPCPRSDGKCLHPELPRGSYVDSPSDYCSGHWERGNQCWAEAALSSVGAEPAKCQRCETLESERDAAREAAEQLAAFIAARVASSTDDAETICIHCPAADGCKGEDCAARLVAAYHAYGGNPPAQETAPATERTTCRTCENHRVGDCECIDNMATDKHHHYCDNLRPGDRDAAECPGYERAEWARQEPPQPPA